MVEESKEKSAIDEFMNILSNWINAYKWQIYSYLAFKSSSGIRLVFGRIIFVPGIDVGIIKNTSPKFYETEHIIASHGTLSISPKIIEQCLYEAKEKKVIFSDRPFTFDKPQIFYDPIYPPFLSYNYGPRLPTIIIQENGSNEMQRIDSRILDWETKSADQPFDNMDELLTCVGLSRLSEIRNLSKLEIVAKSPVQISDKSTIANGQASIILNASTGMDVNKIKLGFRIIYKNNIERFSIYGGKMNWARNEDLMIGNYCFKVEDTNLLQAFVSYNNFALHSWYISDPLKQVNHRYSIHSLFDKNLDILKRLLFEEKNNFEYGIALLLNILGFSVSHHGKIKKIQEGPDIIALTPRGNIAVIECTVGLLDKDDKLAKLVQRTNLIRKKLVETGFGYLLVQPVIITMLTRNEVSGHLLEAGKHDIVVVCKEELTKLLSRATFLPDPEGLFKEATQLIPENEHHDNH